jgi:hypothetical protein
VPLGRGWIDAKGANIVIGVGLNLIAHGGELAVSARGVVARIKHKQDPGFLEQLPKLISLAVRCGCGEVRCNATWLKQAHEATRLVE